ncbi:MAG: hypothetical protein IKX70_02195 [Treponema sp.]|nr:hypothetical protein [Treponema sp.]
MNTVSKLIILTCLIDENIGRVFLLGTPLREAVKASIQFSDIEKRIRQFKFYSNSVFDKLLDQDTDLSFLKKEVSWSIKQCDRYLKEQVTENTKLVFPIISNYKQILQHLL